MKWWKKFLSKIFSDEEIDEDTMNHAAANNLNNRQQHAEMKTRVMYQYPKGEFRFPLIKDLPKNGPEYRNEQNQSKHPAPRTPIVQTGKKDQKRTAQAGPNQSREQANEKEGWRKVEPKNSRPFEPTHIPSPVYGSHRPKKKVQNAPEFELTDSFLRQIKEKTREKHKVLQIKSDSETQQGFPPASKQESEVEIFSAFESIGEAANKKNDQHIELLKEEPAFREAAPAIESAPFNEKPDEIFGDENSLGNLEESNPGQKMLTKEESFEDEKESRSAQADEHRTGTETAPIESEISIEPDLTLFPDAEAPDKERNHVDSAAEIDSFVLETANENADAEPPVLNKAEKKDTALLLEGYGNIFEDEDISNRTGTEPVIIESDMSIDTNLSPSSNHITETDSNHVVSEAEISFDLETANENADAEPPVLNRAEKKDIALLLEEHGNMFEDEIESEAAPADEDISNRTGREPAPIESDMSIDTNLTPSSNHITETDSNHVDSEAEISFDLETANEKAQTNSLDVEFPVQYESENKDTTLAMEENSDMSSGEEPSLENRSSSQKEKEQGNQDAQTKKSKPRPHLPFNVLMLSQDKLKWERQKNREAKSSGVTGGAPAGKSKETTSDYTASYGFPPIDLLEPPVAKTNDWNWLNEQSALLDETLENFNVKARVVRASQGPSVTRFEVQPDPGVKVNKITNLSNDIKLSMAARDIRMEAPIPGTRSIGIELPNKKSRPVQISEIIGSDTFFRSPSPLTAALGLDISGAPVVTDLRKMPHGLIAGATGSGKSVCINSILVSLLYKARPDELKLLLVDPKMVELAPYNHIPHLVSPVITDVKAATAALKWAVDEMEHRYELFVHANVRDIDRFNYFAEKSGRYSDKLPYIVIVIDELADLMMVAPAEVEESICRIAQKARACGIHLLIATQRPSVDVITGLIKANVPTRIAFSVSSQVDSRTVIDVSGAEKLLGRGDMLFLNNGSVKPVRLQGTFVSDEEIDRVIEHVRAQGKPNYLFKQEELLKKAEIQENEDELFVEACEFVIKQGNASTSLLQRHFRIGYNRAARLMEMMEEHGVITGARGSRPRDVLISEEDFHSLKDSLVQ